MRSRITLAVALVVAMALTVPMSPVFAGGGPPQSVAPAVEPEQARTQTQQRLPAEDPCGDCDQTQTRDQSQTQTKDQSQTQAQTGDCILPGDTCLDEPLQQRNRAQERAEVGEPAGNTARERTQTRTESAVEESSTVVADADLLSSPVESDPVATESAGDTDRDRTTLRERLVDTLPQGIVKWFRSMLQLFGLVAE